jgi:hypothetical protein
MVAPTNGPAMQETSVELHVVTEAGVHAKLMLRIQ